MTSRILKLLIILLLTLPAVGQPNKEPKINYKKKKGKVEVNVSSEVAFYCGDNIHILHIGDKEYSLSQQVIDENGGQIIFFLDEGETVEITEGEEVWMSYGDMLKPGAVAKTNIQEFCELNSTNCWYFGKYYKNLIKDEN